MKHLFIKYTIGYSVLNLILSVLYLCNVIRNDIILLILIFSIIYTGISTAVLNTTIIEEKINNEH